MVKPLLDGKDFKLGLFSANCSGGMAVSKAGFAGMTLSFFDYAGELPYFAEEVIPRLEAKGVRLLR